MSKKPLALLVAVFIPFLLFNFVVFLNESSNLEDLKKEKKTSFAVEKQKKIKKLEQKQKKKKRPKRKSEKLPSIKPANTGGNIGGDGLSFGLPGFDESEFGDFKDVSLLGDIKGREMDRDSVDSAPKVIRRSPIVYPELARKQGISGYVTLNVLISEEGNVEDVEIIESKPEDVFDLQAASTIRKWKFEPATYLGKKVKVWATQKIVFKLD